MAEIRLLRGELGADSPVLDAYDDTLTADRWHAWLTVGADRDADRPSDRDVLAVALDVDEPAWTRWWDRPHQCGGLTHRAERIGDTLASACGYSEPFTAEAATYPIGNRAIRDSRRIYCARCTGLARPIL